MKENFDECFRLVLQHEGHYVNDPRDPGGRTNMGVTQRNWEAWLQHPVTEEAMRKLTVDQVRPFYRTMYWDKIRGDDLPSGVDYALFDFAVNSGVHKASRCIQEIVGVPADGIIGKQTLKAIKAHDSKEIVSILCGMRSDFLKGLSTFKTFGKGWMIRVAQVKSSAASMV